MSVGWVVAVVLGWTVLRLAEHVLSEVNTGALLARGALERCERQHLPLLLANAAVPLLAIAAVALHVRTQGVDAVFGAVSGVALGWLLAAESLHWWAILTLRRRWTTGVLVLPGETPSVRGPYRWLRHPGYVGGATSGALLPLVADSWPAALAAAVLLGVVVVARVRCEDGAWAGVGAAVGPGG